jgi:hypothetical protein
MWKNRVIDCAAYVAGLMMLSVGLAVPRFYLFG